MCAFAGLGEERYKPRRGWLRSLADNDLLGPETTKSKSFSGGSAVQPQRASKRVRSEFNCD